MPAAGSGDAIAFSTVLLSDGRIVATGYVEIGSRNHDFALACYNPSGTLNQSFGNGGRVTTDFFGATDDIAYGLAAQSDGKLVLGGRTGAYPIFHFALARYTNNGKLDQTFGAGGKVSTTFDNRGQGCAVTIQRDAGSCWAAYPIPPTVILTSRSCVILSPLQSPIPLARDNDPRLISRQNFHHFFDRIPIARRRWHTKYFLDLAEIADCLHLAKVQTEDESVLDGNDLEQPLVIRGQT
jgi:uncharacterized delta-60 repeat protein